MSQHLSDALRNEILGRILRDDSFRIRLLADPQGTFQAENYPVDPVLVDILQNLNATSLEDFVAEYERRFGGPVGT